MKKKISPFLILCAAICFSSSGFFVKAIPWGSFAIGGGRTLVAACVIFLYLKLRKHKLVFNKSVFLCGAAIAASGYFYVLSAKMTTAAAAIILEFTAPVFIILFSLVFFRKKPTKLDLIIMPIVICGILCFFYDSLVGPATAPNPLLGNIFGLGAGMTYAVVFMMKMIPGSDNLSSIFVGCVISAVIGFPALITEVTTPGNCTVEILVMMFLLGAVQYASSYIFMAEGLDHTPAFAASLISTIEPILNPLLTAFMLDEKIGMFSLIGSVVVIGSVLCYNLIKDHMEKQKTLSNKES
ncbi:MAG: EamA family transporter [Clostridia bacterium]|nr:EamA family transporter [Clostridia bacterium]